MLTCNLQGGLGNQLFQIFTTIALSMKINDSFFFINKYQLTDDSNVKNGATIRYTYWDTFLSSLRPFLKDQSKLPNLDLYIKEQSFCYDPTILTNLLISISNTKMLVGYFQSYKYFDLYKSQLLRLFKIDNKQFIMRELHRATVDFDNTISIHFRLGDYKKLTDYHPILTDEYYINALNYIMKDGSTSCNKNRNVLYFCEDNDHIDVLQTICNLQHIFTDLIFERADNRLYDWEQLLLMSLCKDNIIANSTFSWWAAYFNTNPNKTVCYPANWFGPKAGHDVADLFPEDWTSTF